MDAIPVMSVEVGERGRNWAFLGRCGGLIEGRVHWRHGPLSKQNDIEKMIKKVYTNNLFNKLSVASFIRNE